MKTWKQMRGYEKHFKMFIKYKLGLYKNFSNSEVISIIKTNNCIEKILSSSSACYLRYALKLEMKRFSQKYFHFQVLG